MSSKTFSARELMESRIELTRSLAMNVLQKWTISDEDSDRILALLGQGAHCQRLHASDLAGRLEAGKILAQLFVKMSAEHPGRRFFFISFTDDVGNTLDRVPVMRFEELKAKTGQAIRALNMPGLVILGMHPFCNYPGEGLGRQISVDAHALLWSDRDWDYKAVEQAMNSSRGWQSKLTDRPVDIRPVNPAELDRVAYYMLKPWHAAKNVMSNNKKPEAAY